MDCCRELAEPRRLRGAAGPGRRRASPAPPARWPPRGGVGLDIDLDLVPLRETLAPGRDPGLGEPGAHAGRGAAGAARRGDRRLPALGPRRDGDRHGDRGREPGGALRRRGGRRPARRACWPTRRRSTRCRASPRPPAAPLDLATIPEPADLAAAWRDLLAHPNVASRRWIYERYDHLVGRQHDPPPGRRRGRGAPARIRARDRAHHRLRRAPLRDRPARRRPRVGARGRAQPGVRRRAAGGGDRLPQLPQPREGLHRLAAGRGRSPGWRTP